MENWDQFPWKMRSSSHCTLYAIYIFHKIALCNADRVIYLFEKFSGKNNKNGWNFATAQIIESNAPEWKPFSSSPPIETKHENPFRNFAFVDGKSLNVVFIIRHSKLANEHSKAHIYRFRYTHSFRKSSSHLHTDCSFFYPLFCTFDRFCGV